MRWRRSVTVVASAAGAALAIGTMAASPAGASMAATAAVRPAATQFPIGHWGPAQPVPGLAALNAGGSAQVTVVSCHSPGFCTAAGTYQDAARRDQVFTVDEFNGVWGQAAPVPGLRNLNSGGANATALSCADVGRCAVGGWYIDGAGASQPFVADSLGGSFDNAHRLITLGGSVRGIGSITALSCATPGNCTAAMSLPVVPPGSSPIPAPFVASEVNGTWSAVQAVPSPIRAGGPPPPAGINSLSCWAPGDCLAGGFYNSNGVLHTLVATQSNGTWANLNFTEIPGITNVIGYNSHLSTVIKSVSCSTAGDCAIGGIYHDTAGNQQVFDAARRPDGSFFAQTIPASEEINAAGDAVVNDISCAAPGDCAVAGNTFPAAGDQQAFADDEGGGAWDGAVEFLGIANLSGSDAGPVSCGGTGDCVTGGWFIDTAGHRQAFRANEIQHRWGPASEIAGNLNAGGDALVSDASCTFFGSCTIGGFYTDSAGHRQGFVADESPQTTTAVTLTSGNVAAGNAAREHITVTVAGATGGTPTGTVTVKAGNTTVCVITLASGSGDCTLADANLPPGDYAVTASYSGDGTYLSSPPGGGRTVHVLPASVSTSTSLGLSAAKATFGREQAEHLSVTVTAPGQAGDTPSGKVTLKAGSTTLGKVILTGGKATFSLGATKLRPGTYKVTASYGGDLANNGSPSGSKTLTVAPEPTTTALTLSAAKVKVGHEQAEHLTVRVKPQTAGTPAGKVTIKAGSRTICAITLKNGKGTCTLSASKLRPGKYALTATYPGAALFAGSTSPKKALTVTK